MKNVCLDEWEVEFITTALEVLFKDYWSKWTCESQETFKNILEKMEGTGYYEIPKGVRELIG